MSQELATACDKLLATTSILSHSYGVPKVMSSEATINHRIQQLEQEHVKLYDELSHKLDDLIYCHDLSRLQDGAVDVDGEGSTIDAKYQQIVQSYPMIEPHKLESFLKSHNSAIKTDVLLNNYIQLTAPILRSIHQDNKALTNTELTILSNLDKMYGLESGLVFKIMNKFKQSQVYEQQYNDLVYENERVLVEELKPRLITLRESNDKLVQLNKQLIESKQHQIDGLELDQESVKRIESKYHDLVGQWDYLSKLSILLPMLITSLPINWYEDKALFNIIQHCEDFADRLDNYQTLLNIDSIKNIDIKDLLLLEFDEFIANSNGDANDL